MLPRLSLSQKMISLLALMLAVQVVFVISLAIMQKNEIRQIDEGLKIQSVITSMNQISNLWSIAASDAFRQLIHPESVDSAYIDRYTDQLRAQFGELKSMVTDADDAKQIADIEAVTNDAISLLARARQSWTGKRRLKFNQQLGEVGLLADDCTAKSDTFIDRLMERQKRAYEKQAEDRNLMKLAWIAGLGLNVVMVVAVAFFFTRDIAHKFAVITENSERFAEGSVLLPELGGNDEIADLDREFHKMADALIAANIKERAAVDNALDLICSLDGNGAFLTVNPAAERILGYGETELVGRPYIDLVVPEDRERTDTAIKKLMTGESNAAIDHGVTRRAGGRVDLQMSGHWSESDQSLFCVIYDVTERRNLVRMKQQFTNLITNELRGPLKSTAQSLKELQSPEVDNDLAALRSETMVYEVKPVLQLISDLLELEKIDAAMLSLDMGSVNLADLISETVSLCLKETRQRRLKINLDAAESLIEGDRHRLKQAIASTLAFAIASARQGSSIDISCRVEDHAVIEILQRGEEISDEVAQLIFQPFTYLPSIQKNSQPERKTSGLGLSIARLIVEAHQGTIGVTSLGDGVNKFWLKIPIGHERQKTKRDRLLS